MTFSARSFCEPASRPASAPASDPRRGRVPLMGWVSTCLPRRRRKSSGEALATCVLADREEGAVARLRASAAGRRRGRRRSRRKCAAERQADVRLVDLAGPDVLDAALDGGGMLGAVAARRAPGRAGTRRSAAPALRSAVDQGRAGAARGSRRRRGRPAPRPTTARRESAARSDRSRARAIAGSKPNQPNQPPPTAPGGAVAREIGDARRARRRDRRRRAIDADRVGGEHDARPPPSRRPARPAVGSVRGEPEDVGGSCAAATLDRTRADAARAGSSRAPGTALGWRPWTLLSATSRRSCAVPCAASWRTSRRRAKCAG